MKTKKQIPASDYRRLSDEELIRRYTDLQEYNAMYYIFERYGHMVFGWELQQAKNPEAAKSSMERVFIDLLEEFRKSSIKEFKHWLFQHVTGHDLDDNAGASRKDGATDPVDSSNLTRRQMRDYISDRMEPEEYSAAKHHVTHCTLCSHAIEGMQAYPERSAQILDALQPTFMNKHFNPGRPQLYLNSFAPAAARVQKHSTSLWLNLFIALFLAPWVITLVYWETHKHQVFTTSIPVMDKTVSEPVVYSRPAGPLNIPGVTDGINKPVEALRKPIAMSGVFIARKGHEKPSAHHTELKTK